MNQSKTMKSGAEFIALAAAGLFVLAGPALAQHAAPATPPAAGSLLPQITDHKTPGGLAFRYARIPTAKNQSIRFAWQDGYALRSNIGLGLPLLGPALVMQGPKGVVRSEFVEDIKDLSASMRLYGRMDATFGGLRAAPENFPASVKLFARVLGDPALQPRRLQQMQTRYLNLIKRVETRAPILSSRTRARLTYKRGPMFDMQTGDTSVVAKVTTGQVDNWRKAVFSRAGLMIAAAGKSSPQEAAVQIDALFAKLPEKPVASGPQIAAAAIGYHQSGRTIVVKANVPQTMLVTGAWSDFKNDDEAILARVIAPVLRIRLFKALREKLGATYGASARFSRPLPEPLYFSLSAAVAHDKAPAALAALKQELQAFLQKGVTAAELEPHKTRLLSALNQGLRRADIVANWLLQAMQAKRPGNTLQTARARITAITAGQVNAAITGKLAGRDYLTVIVAPSADGFKNACVITAPAEVANCR